MNRQSPVVVVRWRGTRNWSPPVSDTPSWPDWSPDEPGDIPPPPPPNGGVMIERDSAMPPPPQDPGMGWTPPPPPGKRAGWIVPVIILAVLVGVGLLGAAALLVVRSTSSTTVDEPTIATAQPTPDGPDPVETDGPDVGGPAVVTAADAVTEALLTAIDEAEVTMITFQVESTDGVDADGVLLDGGEALVTAAATKGLDGLNALRDQLREIEQVDPDATTPGLEAIRDGYVDHLDAWRAWMEAVRDAPELLEATNEDGAPFSADIASTADIFVDELRIGLPSDTSTSLREYAQFIIDRGFGGSGNGGDLV